MTNVQEDIFVTGKTDPRLLRLFRIEDGIIVTASEYGRL